MPGIFVNPKHLGTAAGQLLRVSNSDIERCVQLKRGYTLQPNSQQEFVLPV